jgi:hypothetical protein
MFLLGKIPVLNVLLILAVLTLVITIQYMLVHIYSIDLPILLVLQYDCINKMKIYTFRKLVFTGYTNFILARTASVMEVACLPQGR